MYSMPRDTAAGSFSMDYMAGRKQREKREKQEAKDFPSIVHACCFWRYKCRECDLNVLPFQWQAHTPKSLSVPYKVGDAYLPAGRNLSSLNISTVFHIDNVFTHSWSPIAYAVPPVSPSKQTFRESWTFHNASWDCESAAASISFIWLVCSRCEGNKTKAVLLLSHCQMI